MLVLMVALRIVQRLRGRTDAAGDAPGSPAATPGPTDSTPTADADRTPLRDVIRAPAMLDAPPGTPDFKPRQVTRTAKVRHRHSHGIRPDRRTGPARTDRDDAPTASPADPVDDVAGMKTARTGGVVRAGAVMAVATLVSRLTGFLSKVVLLSVLGFGIVNDAYTLANTLPNIVFELLIGGVLTSVAIPLLSRARSDPDGGEGYTQRLMTVALVGLLIGATGAGRAGRAAADQAVPVRRRSLVDHGLANSLAYLLLPQIFFYGIAALFGAILNTKEKFGVPAWAPVANNLVVIGVGIALLPDARRRANSADGSRAHLADPRAVPAARPGHHRRAS